MPVPEFLKNPLSLYEIAAQYWDLRCYPTQYVFSLLALISEDKLEREKCIELGSAEGQEEWLNYCRRPKRTVLEPVPCIMIGPGTGLAPFRSLLQERMYKQTASRETLHLFFGCRYKEKDFHCKEELEKMTADGHLTLYCAFSRDQDDKIYVQHKITEHASTLWKLINDERGCIFISGNAKNMPDNVKDAFIEDVFSKVGGLSTDDAKSMIKMMDEIGRLQVETW
ncbi:hypothetical protein K1T71_013531 [Dendrolimus kikuchii]|uniref:Uncharacterized protein n=1 Tax=Dendrolimus kikuchii TaxID=765133 RepID=A0ACC1CGR1_9NEOP|nr:hypothetical protein K1T71_013531 [Dendrolimus kikuchii]